MSGVCMLPSLWYFCYGSSHGLRHWKAGSDPGGPLGLAWVPPHLSLSQASSIIPLMGSGHPDWVGSEPARSL